MNNEISKKNQAITDEWRKSALHKMEHKNWTYVSRECYSILEYFLCCSDYEPVNSVENSNKLNIALRTFERKMKIMTDYGLFERKMEIISFGNNKARKNSYYQVFPPKFEELNKEILGFTYPEYPSYDLKFGKIYQKKSQFYRSQNSKKNFLKINASAKNASIYETGGSAESLDFFKNNQNNENCEIGGSLKSLDFFNDEKFSKNNFKFEIGASLKSLDFFMEILKNKETLQKISQIKGYIDFMGFPIETNKLPEVAKFFIKNGLFENFQNWRKYINTLINEKFSISISEEIKISSSKFEIEEFLIRHFAEMAEVGLRPFLNNLEPSQNEQNKIPASNTFQPLTRLSQCPASIIEANSSSIPENEPEVLYAMPHDVPLAGATSESAQNELNGRPADPLPESPYQSPYGHSQVLHQDARRGTKKENAMNLSGFIKTGLKTAPSAKSENKRHLIIKPKKTKNTINGVHSKKFIEYWNSLADENDALPKCRITWGGKTTNAYKTALAFFSELRTGKLFKGNSSFRFSKAELEKYQFVQKNGYTDDDLFRVIKKVADFYLTDKRTLPTKFEQLIYTEFTFNARKEGTGKSVFLDLIQQTEMGSLSFSNFYDSLTEDELSILRHRFKPFYYRLRGVDMDYHEITDAEWYEMYSGYKVLEKLWNTKYKEVCANSFRFKDITYIGDFIGFYLDTIELKRSSIPFAKIFNPKYQYLEEFLNYLEEH